MRILLCHNHYQQLGGEDLSFAATAGLLERYGHEVIRYTRNNDEVAGMNRWVVARETIWSQRTKGEVQDLIRRCRPALVHCLNTFPLISPAVYYAALAQGVPVLQGLRNYRLLCPNAIFLRGGRVCEDCMGKAVPWPAIRHRCYRGDRMATVAVAAMLTTHRAVKTWSRAVTLYYTVSRFARQKFIEGGFPANRVVVKPNFVEADPGVGSGRGGYAVYVGRLSEEKGVAVLLDAWSRLDEPLPLKIIGDGPLSSQVEKASARDSRIEYLGHLGLNDVYETLGNAAFLIMPSIWYETFGRTIIEAYAKGTPVIGSRIGAVAELVLDGETGCHFEAGSPDDLVAKMKDLLCRPKRLAQMRRAARCRYEAEYTAETHYTCLMETYEKVLEAKA